MNTFRVTKDRRVFLGDVEIQKCLGFEVVFEVAKDPEVLLRVSVEKVDIDEYKDAWNSSEVKI